MNTNQAQPTTDQLIQIIQVLTEIVRQGLDLEWVMTKIAEKAQLIVKADGAVVEMADPETDEMVYRAVAGQASGQLGLRLPCSTSMSGLCVSTAAVMHCEDSETDDRVNREACRRVGLRSMICVPLFYDHQAVGVLKVFSSKPYGFGANHILILKLMAEVIAATMSNAVKYSGDELFRQAKLDSLTGLANRSLFYEKLRQIMDEANHNGSMFGVLMVDMDGLKAINDGEGHLAGDRAIQEIASRISAVIRQTDTVARLGGDEFAVLLLGIERPSDAALAVRRVEAQCDQPYYFERKRLPLGASVGMAVYPLDGDTIEALLGKADTLMYTAKKDRKGVKVTH